MFTTIVVVYNEGNDNYDCDSDTLRYETIQYDAMLCDEHGLFLCLHTRALMLGSLTVGTSLCRVCKSALKSLHGFVREGLRECVLVSCTL